MKKSERAIIQIGQSIDKMENVKLLLSGHPELVDNVDSVINSLLELETDIKLQEKTIDENSN